MGGGTSTTNTGTTGNVGIYSMGGFAGGVVTGITTGNISFASGEGSGSTVANATGKKLRIFYHKEKLKLEDLLDSKTTQKTFNPKAGIPFIDLLPKQHLAGPSLEEGFASIFVADPEDSDVYVETICLNFEVPHGACCIVTANNEVKFRKCDGGVWIDENDHDHCPQ